ncbi:MAG TPA: alpha-hydroxy acid oxidase [Sphingomonadaceae bacterium]|nr:alpha-hydroxy acid oxidase [Sphingomonadaceae bacterium]
MGGPPNFGCYNIADLRERAQRRLPLGVWEYVERGVEDELGLARNRAALDAVTFRPRVLRNVETIDNSAVLLGCPSSAPFAVAPTGAAGLLWHHGDLALAKAAARAGVPFTVSSASTMDIEQIARAGGTIWFQLYMWADRSLSLDVVDRAATLGCQALFVTLDLPVPPNREYLQRNGFGTPFRLNPKNALDILFHPRWLLGVMGRYALGGGIPSQANLPDRLRNRVTQSASPGALFKQDNLDWDEVAKLRERWQGKLVLKGILRADDAIRAAAIGADAIVVSNHGGRGFDGSMAPVDALPDIVAAAGDQIEVLLDSGVRRGSDVVKALALGAKGCLVGRPALYGLACGGEDGVYRALDLLKSEISRSMALLGARNLGEVDGDLLA